MACIRSRARMLWTSRAGKLVSVVCVALMASACREMPVEPAPSPLKAPRFELREGTEFDVTVASDITIFDESRKPVKKFKHKATVRAKVKDGLAIAAPKRGTIKGVSLVGASLVDEEIIDPSINLMPVLGVTDGEISNYYNDTGSDGQGNSVYVTGSSGTEDVPVPSVAVYQNGQYQIRVNMDWSQVSGGYTLLEQVQEATGADGSGARIVSVADQSTITVTSQPSALSLFIASAEVRLTQVACAFGPSIAFASTSLGTPVNSEAFASAYSCFWPIAEFVGATVGMSFATVHFPAVVSTGQIVNYLLGWGAWTRSLYSMLRCLNLRM